MADDEREIRMSKSMVPYDDKLYREGSYADWMLANLSDGLKNGSISVALVVTTLHEATGWSIFVGPQAVLLKPDELVVQEKDLRWLQNVFARARQVVRARVSNVIDLRPVWQALAELERALAAPPPIASAEGVAQGPTLSVDGVIGEQPRPCGHDWGSCEGKFPHQCCVTHGMSLVSVVHRCARCGVEEREMLTPMSPPGEAEPKKTGAESHSIADCPVCRDQQTRGLCTAHIAVVLGEGGPVVGVARCDYPARSDHGEHSCNFQIEPGRFKLVTWPNTEVRFEGGGSARIKLVDAAGISSGPHYGQLCRVCGGPLGNDAQATALGCCSGSCARHVSAPHAARERPGEALRAARVKHHFTMGQVARAFGLTVPQVSAAELHWDGRSSIEGIMPRAIVWAWWLDELSELPQCPMLVESPTHDFCVSCVGTHRGGWMGVRAALTAKYGKPFQTNEEAAVVAERRYGHKPGNGE